MALFLGVLVAGLGIGAALSLLGRSRSAPPASVAGLATDARATDVPATDVPATESPSSTPTGGTSPSSDSSPRAVPTLHRARPPVAPSPAIATTEPTALETALASPASTATPAAVRATAVSATVAPSAKVATLPSTSPSEDRQTPVAATLRTAPTAEPAQTAVPEPPVSVFSRASAAVVRQFLQSLIDGDETTARDTLVDGKADLPEAAIVDRDSRVRNVVAHGTGETAEVTVVIETPGGNYAGRYYLVKSGAGNPQIRAHEIARL